MLLGGFPFIWAINTVVLDSIWSTDMHSPGAEALQMGPLLFEDLVRHGGFVVAP